MAKFSRSYNHNKNFAADVEDFVTVSEKRMNALIRASVSDVIENANTPTAKGGRMRVDTGFLRASARLSLNGMPSGPERGDKKEPGSYGYDEGSAINATLGEVRIGSVIYFGWTAAYARYREVWDGFLEGALRHWDRIVAFRTDEIRERIKK